MHHCFVASFGLMLYVFHLVWSTWCATNIFVVGWRKSLRIVECSSTLSNKFCLCFHFSWNVQLVLDPHQANQPISTLYFFNPLLYLVFCHLNLSQNNLRSPCILGKRGTWLSACHWLNKPENEPLTVQRRYQNVENNERSHEMRKEWCSIWTQKWGLKPLKSLRGWLICIPNKKFWFLASVDQPK